MTQGEKAAGGAEEEEEEARPFPCLCWASRDVQAARGDIRAIVGRVEGELSGREGKERLGIAAPGRYFLLPQLPRLREIKSPCRSSGKEAAGRERVAKGPQDRRANAAGFATVAARGIRVRGKVWQHYDVADDEQRWRCENVVGEEDKEGDEDGEENEGYEEGKQDRGHGCKIKIA